MFLAICQVYIKEMDLAIACNNFAISIDQYRGVVELSCQLRITFDDTSTMYNHFMLACLFLQKLTNRPRNGLRSAIKSRIRSEIRPEFGETNELCTHVSCLIQKSHYIGQILSRVITCVYLDDNCS